MKAKLLFLLLSTVLAPIATAATVTAAHTTTYTVAQNCEVTTPILVDFGLVNPVSRSTMQKAWTLNVACTEGISYYVDASALNYPITIGAATVGLQLFRDSGYTTSMYYDGVTHMGTATVGNGVTQTQTLYVQLSGDTTGTTWTPLAGADLSPFSGTINGAIVFNW